MGVTLLRVFPHFQGGGFLTAHHGFFFCLLFTTTVEFTEQPSVCPLTLSAHWCSISSTPPRTPSAYWRSTPAPIALFVKVSPGRACNDYKLTFLCWCEMTNLSANFFISQTFALSLTANTFVILKTPCCDSWDIQGQSLSRGFKAFSCTILLPVLVLAFAWQLFSSLHLHLVPFLGSIVLQFHNWLLKFWKSIVLDSAKPFGQICFFCYIALSILSPTVHLKERVVAL